MLVDLHSHVLPGIDDGARDNEHALEMLRIAERDGTSLIAATPHSAAINDPSVIRQHVTDLRELARARGLTIEIVTGSEVRFDADLAARYAAGELITLNGTPWLLLELSLRAEWSPFVRQGIYDLQVAGAWPILAHAERYPAVQRDASLLEPLIEQGVLIQVNADSITGQAGRGALATAETLIRRRMAHLIASDAHGVNARPPRIAAALQRAGVLAGGEYEQWLMSAAQRIIEGQAITPPDVEAPLRANRLRKLLSLRR